MGRPEMCDRSSLCLNERDPFTRIIPNCCLTIAGACRLLDVAQGEAAAALLSREMQEQ